MDRRNFLKTSAAEVAGLSVLSVIVAGELSGCNVFEEMTTRDKLLAEVTSPAECPSFDANPPKTASRGQIRFFRKIPKKIGG